jgi:hypothetical protein
LKAANKELNYRRIVENRLKGLFAYFREARIRIERMPETPAARENIEQAGYAYLDSIILTCSYLDALSVFCCGEGRDAFIRFLQNYSQSEHQRWYRRISCLYLDQPPLDRKGDLQAPLDRFDPTAIRSILYGSMRPDTRTDISLDEALHRLASADTRIDAKTLNRFSYAAYLYERYRCHGVHNVQPPAPGISGDAEPHYEPRQRPNRLVMPRSFILDTLKACIENFEREVLEKLESGLGLDTPDDYHWLKEAYGLKSSFIETVCRYYPRGPNARMLAAPL